MQYNSRRFRDSAMHIILFFVPCFCNHPLICINDDADEVGEDVRICCCVTTGRNIALRLHVKGAGAGGGVGSNDMRGRGIRAWCAAVPWWQCDPLSPSGRRWDLAGGDPELARRWAGHRSRSAGLGPR